MAAVIPGVVADSSAEGLKAQLAEVWDSLIALGSELSDEQWAAATPCPGWSVGAQYAHMIGTESMLLGRDRPDVDPGRPDHVRNDIGGVNEVWVAALTREPRPEVLARFAETTGARRQALAAMGEDDFDAPSWTPVGQADYRRFMQVRVFDCWVHEHDIRDAIGRPGHEDGPAAEQSVDELARAIGYLVGKKAAAPDGSSMSVELTGPVHRSIHAQVVGGRALGMDSLAGPATATVRLSSTAFTRLACGRVDPGQVLGGALGGVELAGDAELGERFVRNLAYTI
jgi:uncharacterized protein (TIGR03083 family)